MTVIAIAAACSPFALGVLVGYEWGARRSWALFCAMQDEMRKRK